MPRYILIDRTRMKIISERILGGDKVAKKRMLKLDKNCELFKLVK